jgi:DNA replication protein DnaC
MIERHIRAARFPAMKSFDAFDFNACSETEALACERARQTRRLGRRY